MHLWPTFYEPVPSQSTSMTCQTSVIRNHILATRDIEDKQQFKLNKNISTDNKAEQLLNPTI